MQMANVRPSCRIYGNQDSLAANIQLRICQASTPKVPNLNIEDSITYRNHTGLGKQWHITKTSRCSAVIGRAQHVLRPGIARAQARMRHYSRLNYSWQSPHCPRENSVRPQVRLSQRHGQATPPSQHYRRTRDFALPQTRHRFHI